MEQQKGRIIVPFWVFPIITTLVPLLQYALIKLRMPKMIYYLMPFSLALLSPVYLFSEFYALFGCCVFVLTLHLLRLTDVALQPAEVARSWMGREYFEFYFTFYTKRERLLLKSKGKPAGSANCVLPENRTIDYYARTTWRLLVEYAFYNVLMWYAQEFPPNRNPPVGHFISTPAGFLDNLVFGLRLYLVLSIGYTFLFHIIGIIFNVPFEPIMNSPFTSISIRDFWSHRWNAFVKENLYRIGFKPTVAILQWLSPVPKDGKIPKLHSLLGAMSAFLVSGLFHEWMVLVLMGRPTHWENLYFFLIQGVITAAEVYFVQIWKSAFGFDPIKATPQWISTPITLLLFLAMSPLFLNPYVREDILMLLRVPLVTDVYGAIQGIIAQFV